MEKLMIVEEIAKLLRVKRETLQSKRWRRRSGCPLFRRGKRLFVFEKEFYKWLNEGKKNEAIPWG